MKTSVLIFFAILAISSAQTTETEEMPESLGVGYSCLGCVGELAAKAVMVFIDVHAVLFGIFPLLPVLEHNFSDFIWALKHSFIQCSELLKSSGMCESGLDIVENSFIGIFRDLYELKDGNLAVIGNMFAKWMDAIYGLDQVKSSCF